MTHLDEVQEVEAEGYIEGRVFAPSGGGAVDESGSAARVHARVTWPVGRDGERRGGEQGGDQEEGKRLCSRHVEGSR